MKGYHLSFSEMKKMKRMSIIFNIISLNFFFKKKKEKDTSSYASLEELYVSRTCLPSNHSIAIITFPPSLHHRLLKDDKELAQLLTGYQDMVGLLNVSFSYAVKISVGDLMNV